MSLSRFVGGCEELCDVSVAELIAWIETVDKATWPDWGKGAYRPAVVNDQAWAGLKERTECLVHGLLSLFSDGATDTYRSITTIHPGDYVPHHTDTLVPGWLSRIHVPLVTNPEAWFITLGVEHHMDVGKAYQVNPSIPHAVRNAGKASRIHLMFDVVKG